MNYLQFVEKDNAKVQIGWILEVPNDLSRDEVLKTIRTGYRPKGKWIETINSIGGNLIHDAYECSCCRLDFPYKTKFCPECGADMRGEE